MIKGIDVSALQGNIDWSRVPADFAMIKATQGRGEMYRRVYLCTDDR